jgi:hypothetical protein
MIIKYVIGTLLIAIPVSAGLYWAVKEVGWRGVLAMFLAIMGVFAVILGIFFLTT